jgi:hypothetical protein
MVPNTPRTSTMTVELYTILREGLTPGRQIRPRFLPIGESPPVRCAPPHLTLLDAKRLQLLHQALPATRSPARSNYETKASAYRTVRRRQSGTSVEIPVGTIRPKRTFRIALAPI